MAVSSCGMCCPFNVTAWQVSLFKEKINVGRVIPSITQLESFLIDVIIRNQEYKEIRSNMFRPNTGHLQFSS